MHALAPFRELSRELIAAGLAPETPVALVENASLPDERHFRTRLDLLPLAARTALGSGPALLLIGSAMRCSTEPGLAASDNGIEL